MEAGNQRNQTVALPSEARCPEHGGTLSVKKSGDPNPDGMVEGSCGCVFQVRSDIPRFVPQTSYADAFGVQWNAFRRTQLDSFTGTTISRDRLTRCLGGSLDIVRGASVLEVGCGAGRFTEILLDAGAHVFACDLSGAVDANFANCGPAPDYFVCQASAVSLPVASQSFDFVIALGMIQHTPAPEDTIEALAGAVKPGGFLVVDHYKTPNALIGLLYLLTPRAWLRWTMVRLPTHTAFRLNEALVRALLPAHRVLWRKGPAAKAIRRVWRWISPVFDYYDSYPELGRHLEEWALLDTHDALTDRYKHLRTPQQVALAIQNAGLEVVESRAGGNGVEARGRRAPSGRSLK